MLVTLSITSYQGQSLGDKAQHSFNQNGGTFGRSPDNQWVLPDPERIISSHHGQISFQDGAFYLTDTSTNGIYISEALTPLGKGNSAVLQQGAHLKFGEYDLLVTFPEAVPAQPPMTQELGSDSINAPTFDPLGGVSVTSEPIGDDFDNDWASVPHHSSADSDPFIAPKVEYQEPAPQAYVAKSVPVTPVSVEQIPDNWDDTGLSVEPPAPSNDQPVELTADLVMSNWAEETEAITTPQIDDPFGLDEPLSPKIEAPATEPVADVMSYSIVQPPQQQSPAPQGRPPQAPPQEPLAPQVPPSHPQPAQPHQLQQPQTPPQASPPQGMDDPFSMPSARPSKSADTSSERISDHIGDITSVGNQHTTEQNPFAARPTPQPIPAAQPEHERRAIQQAAVIPKPPIESVEQVIAARQHPEPLSVPGASEAVNPESVTAPVSQQPVAPQPVSNQQQATDNSALFQLFLSAAGIDPAHLDDLDPSQAMQDFGALFREMLQGLIELQQARSQLKNEFRMSLTTIRPIENNPLKFAPNVDEALRILFLNKGGGYLNSNDAIKESVAEVRSHQIAMISGMQSAYMDLMARMAPANFVDDGVSKSALTNAMRSMTKKSNAWSNYNDFYKNQVADADNAFQVLFGESFSRAYEEQVEHISKALQQHTSESPGTPK